MPKLLITSSLEQAELAAPAVKAAALVYSARVLNTFDQGEAVRVLERGIDVVRRLPSHERDALLFSAVTVAAVVSPPHAIRLLSEWTGPPFGSPLQQAMLNMLSHGRVADVVDYLDHPVPGQPYPFLVVGEAMGRCGDDDTRRRVLRRAIDARREEERGEREVSTFAGSQFLSLFSRVWTLLPDREAAAVVREIVGWILAAPDRMTHASSGEGVRFSSAREHALFEILAPLQHLDPSLAQSLCGDHPQLAKAAARFPFGMESMMEMWQQRAQAEAPPADAPPIAQPDVIVAGCRLVPMPEAIATRFAEPFDRAFALYAADTALDNPNEAPSERWPSTWAYREILFKAGQHEGRGATAYLDRVPRADLRLLAAIELAAALVGLPQLGGCTISPPAWRPKREGSADSVPEIAEAQVRALMARIRQRERPPARKPALPPSLDVHIAVATRTIADGPAGGAGADYWTMENVPLKAVLSKVCDTPETRIELPPELESARYDFQLVLPHDVDQITMKRLMQRGIEKYFGAAIAREPRSKRVYVLTAPSGLSSSKIADDLGRGGIWSGSVSWTTPHEPDEVADLRDRFDSELGQVLDLRMVESPSDQPATTQEARRRAMSELAPYGSSLSRGSTITGISQSMTMTELADLLERSLDRLVVDETGLTDAYALNAETDAKTTLDFLAELCRTTGLVVTPGQRDIPMLVLTRHH